MPATPPSTKKRRSREETRQRLLEAALKVFGANGYERATIDEIVREAGFSKGAFYVHFESKDDLFWEMLQDRINAQQEVFREALNPDDSIEANEARILAAVFAMSQGPIGPAIYLEFTAHGMRNPLVKERLSEMYAGWHAFIVDLLTRGQDAGLLRTDIDVPLVSSVLMALFEGSMIQSNLAPEHLRLSNRVADFSRVLYELVAARK